jgi:hypothetical protein
MLRRRALFAPQRASLRRRLDGKGGGAYVIITPIGEKSMTNF